MKAFLVINPGMEATAKQELAELIESKGIVREVLVEFPVKKKEELLKLVSRGQSFRRAAILLDKNKEIDNLELSALKFPWAEFFSSEVSLKVTIENVKGNDARLDISRKVMGKLFKTLESELKFSPKIELKKPEVEILVVRSGEEYFVGIDLCGKDLTSRSYRVFASHAAFKGDLGYYLVRKSGFKTGEKLLIGFAKDGTVAIEAALFARSLAVSSLLGLSWEKFPGWKEVTLLKEQKLGGKTPKIQAVDESNQNMIAAKKNSILAGTKELVEFHRYALDELELKYESGEFDHLFFQLTTKDEDRLNEIYYQAEQLLKSGGTLLLLTRKGVELSVSSKFKLISEEELRRGESFYKVWMMGRK